MTKRSSFDDPRESQPDSLAHDIVSDRWFERPGGDNVHVHTEQLGQLPVKADQRYESDAIVKVGG